MWQVFLYHEEHSSNDNDSQSPSDIEQARRHHHSDLMASVCFCFYPLSYGANPIQICN